MKKSPLYVKHRYKIKFILNMVIVVCIIAAFFLTLFLLYFLVVKKQEESNKPVFYTKTPEVTEKVDFALDDCYLTNKVTGLNRYFIDENSVLWGYGYNDNGQLGIGEVLATDEIVEEPVKIAEQVISVDCSDNGYFCIYLTEDGKLYGMGADVF